ncbi:MAG TPA: nicotinate (nicotinamide) nucleotide adenylyltransferase, partial [Neisseria sp.]|nr:nicotinate (nicotinamide) nucleotide adenylyltransferase [Neisseria sp.]
MKNIGLFGGTFDPIHNGHLHIARAFADEIGLDSVIFLPAGDPYHKEASAGGADARARLHMAELAVADEPRFAVSDCDVVREGATYTFDTVQIFRQHFPAAQLWWLMGMDSLMQLHKWKKWQTLVRHTHIAVAAREGENLAQAPRELHGWLGEALQQGSLKL